MAHNSLLTILHCGFLQFIHVRGSHAVDQSHHRCLGTCRFLKWHDLFVCLASGIVHHCPESGCAHTMLNVREATSRCSVTGLEKVEAVHLDDDMTEYKDIAGGVDRPSEDGAKEDKKNDDDGPAQPEEDNNKKRKRGQAVSGSLHLSTDVRAPQERPKDKLPVAELTVVAAWVELVRVFGRGSEHVGTADIVLELWRLYEVARKRHTDCKAIRPILFAFACGASLLINGLRFDGLVDLILESRTFAFPRDLKAEPETRIRLTLHPPDDAKPVETTAVVRWAGLLKLADNIRQAMALLYRDVDFMKHHVPASCLIQRRHAWSAAPSSSSSTR